jgi:hypothetical protein
MTKPRRYRPIKDMWLEFRIVHDLLEMLKVKTVAKKHRLSVSAVQRVRDNWPLFFWNRK